MATELSKTAYLDHRAGRAARRFECPGVAKSPLATHFVNGFGL